MGENGAKYFVKGSKVTINGRLRQRRALCLTSVSPEGG